MNLVFSKPYEQKRHILYDRSSLFSLRIFFKRRKLDLHEFKIVPVFDNHTFKGVNRG
jgi:hypothetical protein